MATPSALPSSETLSNLFRYDPLPGALLWRYRSIATFQSMRDGEAWNSRYCNTAAGSKDNRGYLRAAIRGHGRYLVHRIIFKMVTGLEPEIIDHVDGDTTNNRIENLRSVDLAENSRNSSVARTNRTGVRGVQWAKERKKWRAFITVERRFRHLGHFDSFDEAVIARKNAETAFGYHPNHGRAAVNP